MLVAVLIVLAGTAAWLVFDSPLTDIRTVDVTGVSVPQADEIRQAAAVPMGEAMATLPTAEVAARVQPLPCVAAVTVQRKWPHTVVVDVVPRTVVGYVPAGSGAELVGSDGTSMGTVPAAPEGATQIKASGEDRTQVALALAGVPPRRGADRLRRGPAGRHHADAGRRSRHGEVGYGAAGRRQGARRSPCCSMPIRIPVGST